MTSPNTSTSSSSEYPQSRTALDGRVYVALTYDELDILDAVSRVKSPSAGAVVMFAGVTRDNFDNKPVSHLSYSAYAPRALATMLQICSSILLAPPSAIPNPDTTSTTADTTAKTTQDNGLVKIAMIHRLGTVPINEESILITVSGKHRKEAWRAGEEALERCKEKVEVWKEEWFEGGEGVWRANRDGTSGERVA